MSLANFGHFEGPTQKFYIGRTFIYVILLFHVLSIIGYVYTLVYLVKYYQELLKEHENINSIKVK